MLTVFYLFFAQWFITTSSLFWDWKLYVTLHVSCVMAIWHRSPPNGRWVLKSRSGCNYVRQIVILCRWEEVLWNTFGLMPTVTSARVVVVAGRVMVVVVHNRVEVGSVVLRARSPGRKVAWKNWSPLKLFSNALFSILLNFWAKAHMGHSRLNLNAENWSLVCKFKQNHPCQEFICTLEAFTIGQWILIP